MNSAGYVIIAGVGDWRLAAVGEDFPDCERLSFSNDATVADKAAAVSERLQQLNYSSTACVLAVPSDWCLCASIDISDIGRGERRREMGYRLEEHLPISAEDFIGDYIELDSSSAIGVCSELARLREITSAFENLGVNIAHICPLALLAAGGLAAGKADGELVLIDGDKDLGGGTFCDFIELKDSRLASWQWTSRADLTEATDCITPALAEAAKVLAGTKNPWIDFRRDALASPQQFEIYRRPLTMLAVAVIAFLLCLIGVFQFRAAKYNTLAARYDAGQADIYRQLNPDSRVPSVGIKRRLQAQFTQLAGLGGRLESGSDDELLLNSPTAINMLRDVLASLPTGVRFRILKLDIKGDSIRVEAQAASHSDAERIASALRQTQKYEVDQPRTQIMKDGGVSFVYNAKTFAAPKAGEAK